MGNLQEVLDSASLTIDWSFAITSANTGYISYSSNTRSKTFTGYNDSNIMQYYRKKQLSDRDKSKSKYQSCVDAGRKERNIIYQCLIRHNFNIKNFYLSDVENDRDSFDLVIKNQKDQLSIIEIKIRNYRSNEKWHQTEGDIILVDKYNELVGLAKENDCDAYQILFWQKDNVMRIYNLRELILGEKYTKEIADFPGSDKKKIIEYYHLDPAEAKDYKIKIVK